MIKVLRIEEVRKADLATIEKQGIPSIELMERAAKSCTAWLMENIPPGLSFTICCGKGNNGGDGLAIARLLWEKGKEVSVIIIEETGTPSSDFLKNLQQWESLSPSGTKTIAVAEEIPIFPPETIIIDAIFGSGLNRSPEGIALETIKKINSSANKIIAIDIPSGLFTDKHTEHLSNVICAGFTLTFQVLKQAFVYAEYEQHIGEWHVLDIGLDSEVIQNAPARAFLPDIQDIHALLPYRPAHGHKGTFGHALLLAGSYGKAGAAILAAGACLRSGTGLVTVRTPARCVIPVQAALPEAMCSPDEEKDFLSDIVKIEKYNAIGVGPGIGIDKQKSHAGMSVAIIFPSAGAADSHPQEQRRVWIRTPGDRGARQPHPGVCCCSRAGACTRSTNGVHAAGFRRRKVQAGDKRHPAVLHRCRSSPLGLSARHQPVQGRWSAPLFRCSHGRKRTPQDSAPAH